MIERREDWEIRLHGALMAARGEAFAWGDHDCCLMAADIVDAMCGSEIAARWRGRYRTARGAARLLHRRGGIDAEMARLGLVERPCLLAQRGDVLSLPVVPELAETGLVLGICLADGIVGAGPSGWWLVPLTSAERAWHVPMPRERAGVVA